MISLLALAGTWCWAQNTVLPGDANANGRVDQYDLPYLGYAYGHVGPARIALEEVTLTGIPQGWAAEFSDGVNYAHADANGNGAVDIMDFIVWSQNYGTQNSVVTPLNLPPAGPGIAAIPVWNANVPITVPATGELELLVPLVFDIPNSQAVNGLAYRIRYDTDYIESATFLANNNWLTADGNGITMQRYALGQINIGSTRFGTNPIQGGGLGGTLALVIITDMVDLIETVPDTLTTWLVLEQALVVSGGFEAIPTRSDSLAIKIYRPGLISDVPADIPTEPTLSLYPNPTTGVLWLQTQHPVHFITIVDVLGQVVRHQTTPPAIRHTLPDLALPPGYYVLHAHGDNYQAAAPFIVR